MATRIQGSGSKSFKGSSNNALAKHTLAGVASGRTLIARVAAHRLATASGGLLAAITDDKGNTWNLVASGFQRGSGSNHLTYCYIYAAYNVAAGNTQVSLDLTYEDDTTWVTWDVDEWSGMATAAAADKTASGSDVGSGTIATGSSGTLAQAAETGIAMIAGPYPYYWNDVGGAGSPPSGWTLINGETGQIATDKLSFQSVYKTLASTTAITVAWTAPDAGLTVAVLATFKDAAATTLVAECNVDDDVVLDAPTEIYVHTGGRPDQVLATRYTGAAISVLGSAGSRKIRVTPAPAGTTAGQSVTFSGFGTTYDMGYYTGTVVAV